PIDAAARPGSDGLRRAQLILRRRLIRLLDENKRRPRDDRGARPNERHVDVLDLPRAGAAGGLEGAFDDVPEAMDAASPEAAAKGVERQFAVQFDAAVLDKVERLAFLAEP